MMEKPEGINMLRFPVLSAALMGLALVTAPALADSAAKIGEWHLDLTQSRFLPGQPVPKQDVRIYQDLGDGMVQSIHRTTRADGSVAVVLYKARDDGKAYPMTDDKGNSAGTIALTPAGPRSQNFVTTNAAGVANGGGNTTISEDGRTLTMTLRRATGNEPARETVVIFRKHSAS